MSKRDLLGIIAKNMSIAAADSITTSVATGDSAYALGNLASMTGKTIEEIKQHLKDSNDGLYHMHVKTFFETADVDPEEFERFIEENPNEVRLGAEFLKILENTVFEKQAKMYAKAFSLYVKREIDETEMNKYVYIIGKIDKYLLAEIEKVKKFKLNPVAYDYKKDDGHLYVNTDEFVKNVNEELVNLGFIKLCTNWIVSGGPQLYEPTPFYIQFKEHILKEL